MREGGEQPGRFKQKKGVQYRLEEIYDNWFDARQAASKTSKEYNSKHGLQWFQEIAFNQMATGGMLKWPEIQAFLANVKTNSRWGPEAHLVWVRM